MKVFTLITMIWRGAGASQSYDWEQTHKLMANSLILSNIFLLWLHTLLLASLLQWYIDTFQHIAIIDWCGTTDNNNDDHSYQRYLHVFSASVSRRYQSCFLVICLLVGPMVPIFTTNTFITCYIPCNVLFAFVLLELECDQTLHYTALPSIHIRRYHTMIMKLNFPKIHFFQRISSPRVTSRPRPKSRDRLKICSFSASQNCHYFWFSINLKLIYWRLKNEGSFSKITTVLKSCEVHFQTVPTSFD